MLVTATAFGQKNHWLLYPSHLDFSSGALNSTVESFSAPTPYAVENSIYDTDGTLLAYIQNGTVIDPANPPSGSTGGSIITKEIGVFPLPGTCDSYCSIALYPTPLPSLYLGMQEFEITPNGIQDLGFNFFGEIGYNNDPMDFGGESGGIAISQIISGTNANRNIYIVTYTGIYQFLIDETGLHLEQHIPNTIFTYNGQTLSFDNIAEAEISPDGQWLAWNSDNLAIVYQVGTPDIYQITEISQRNSSDYIKGLEFTADSEHLFISMYHRGVWDWNFMSGGGGQTSFISGSDWLDYTQLQRGQDDLIYGVSRQNGTFSGELYAISASGIITGTGITVNSGAHQPTLQYGFALPDQVEVEDEAVFHGVQPLSLSPLSSNGTPFATSVPGDVPIFYNCGEINLDDLGSGTIDFFDIQITSVNSLTGEPIYGNDYLDHHITWSSLPGSDIRGWYKGKGVELFDNYIGQTFLMTYTIGNGCGSITREGYFQVISAPDAITMEFDVNVGNGGQCPLAETIQDVCTVSLFFANIDLDQSSGYITYYQLRFTEVDCTTGDEIALIYDGPEESVTDIGSVHGLALNAIDIDGDGDPMGPEMYFVNNNFNNRCIRIDATIGNPCGSETQHAYIRFSYTGYLSRPDDSIGKEVQMGKMGTSVTSNQFLAYPNPVSSDWNIQWTNVHSQPSDLILYDQRGAVVYQKHIEEGDAYPGEKIDMTSFPAGMYYYRLRVGVEEKSGALMKL